MEKIRIVSVISFIVYCTIQTIFVISLDSSGNEQKKTTENLGGLINIKVRDLYFYGNDWILQNFDPRKVMEELPKMKRRDDDVVVCGCHRSGTNWTWEIVNMLVRESRDYQRDRKTPTLLEFQSQDYFDKMALPRILSTHLRFHHIPDDMKKRKCKIIYIQRNPKDVAVSIRHFNKCQFDVDIPWNDYVNAFVNADEGSYVFWIGTALGWDKAIRENPNYPILLVYYEKMKQNPFEEITRMAKFLGVSTDREFINEVVKKTEFSNMKNSKLEFISQTDVLQRRKEYYRKGKVADWKNHFTVAQMNILTKL